MKTAPEPRLVVTARKLWEHRKPLLYAVLFIAGAVITGWQSSSAQDRVMEVDRLLVTVPAHTVLGRSTLKFYSHRLPPFKSPPRKRLEITHPDLPGGMVAIEPASLGLGSGDAMPHLEAQHRELLAKLFKEGIDRPTTGPEPMELGDRKAFGTSWTTPDGTERTLAHIKARRRDVAILDETIPSSTTPKAQTAARLLKAIKHTLTIER